MTLRTGIVGAGVVASNNHIPAVSRNPRTSLRAVCDVDADRAADAAADFAATAYAGLGTMLADEPLDWVHVATPVGTHLDLGRQVVEADVPLLVQKPATTTREELVTLTDLADERNVPVSVVHNWLYYPVMREVRRRVGGGDVGPVRAVQTTVSGEGPPDETYRGDWVFDLPGGAFEEGLPHPLYLTVALGGAPHDESAVDVRTSLAREYDRDVDYDGVQLQYVGEGGTLCSVTVLADSARGTAVRVLGEDGSLAVDFPSMTVDERDDESGPYHFWDERFRRNLALTRDAVEGLARNLGKYGRESVEDAFDRHLPASPDGHYYLIDRAARALESGRQPPRDPAESYWTLALLERVREAAAGTAPDRA